MTHRGPVVRVLLGLGLICAAVIALASTVVLHGAALVIVVLTAGVAACVAYITRDDGRAAAIDAAWKAAAATVAVIVLGTGLVVLAGGAAAMLLLGLAGAVGGALWLLKSWRPWGSGARRTAAAATGAGSPAQARADAWVNRWQPPVSLLPTSDLGSEWLRTTSALACRVEPAARQEIIRRRQETLDELERRDPDGFARWLASGAASDSDPAVFVRGDRTTGKDAA